MAGRAGAERGRIARLADEQGMSQIEFVQDLLVRMGSKARMCARLGISMATLDYWLRKNKLAVVYAPRLVPIDQERAVFEGRELDER